MGTVRISLNDISPQGRNVLVDDVDVWAKPLVEFRMECRVEEALRAELTLLPVEGGWLVRGVLTGAVVQPCDRCAEDTPLRIAHRIDIFAARPGASEGANANDPSDDAEHVTLENGVPILDVAALCWEEFLLALPMRPLCSAQCRGLCSQCGANLNTGACCCARDEGDPRLAALRHVKIQKPD